MNIHERAATLTLAGFIAAITNQLLGGFDPHLQALIAFMAVDTILGWLIAILKLSDKSPGGRLSSAAGFRGLIKKGCCLLVIVVAVHLDLLIGTNGITRDTAILAFALNELLSIVENMGKMGITIPKGIANALDTLSDRNK